jgi:hypothetical protein
MSDVCVCVSEGVRGCKWVYAASVSAIVFKLK